MQIDASVAVFGLYMLFVLGIGVYASRYVEHDPTDFYLAGRAIGTVVLVFTLMATIISSFVFFGLGGIASLTGVGAFVFIGLEVTLFTLFFGAVGVTINRVGRVFELITPTQFLEDRYDSPLPSAIYLLIAFMSLTAFVTGQILGGGIALEILFDVPFTYAALLISAFMAVYIHIAGMRGVVWSDLVQGVVIVTALVALFVYLLVTFGPAELAGGVQSQNPALFSYEGPLGVWQPEYVVTFALFFVFGTAAYPQVYQRFLAADSTRVLRKTALLFPVVSIPVFFTAVAIGAWSVGIIPSPDNPDYVIPLMVQELTGPIVTGIVLSSAVAALMSTTDSVVLTLGSMASRDIYRRHVDPETTDEREVRVGQAVLLLVILAGFVLSLPQFRLAGIFSIIEFGVAGFVAAAPALFFSLYWGRATTAGAVTSMVLSALLMIGFFTEYVAPEYTFGLHYGFVGLVVSSVVFVAVSLFTDPPSEETIRRYMSA